MVSKEKLDFCLTTESKVIDKSIVINDMKSIKNALSVLLENHAIGKDSLLICAEYTGQYTYPLCCCCEELCIDLWLENPAQIKCRSGVHEARTTSWMLEKLPLMLADL